MRAPGTGDARSLRRSAARAGVDRAARARIGGRGWGWTIAATLTGVIGGWLGAQATRAAPTRAAATVEREARGRYHFIRPLLRVDVAGKEDFPELRPLERRFESLIHDAIGAGRARHVSVYFRDLDAERWVGVDEDRRYIAASLMKVPLAVAWLQQSEVQPDLLARQIPFLPDTIHDAEQSITSGAPLVRGRSYSADDLLRKMLVDSDNDAFQLLIDNAGAGVEETWRDLGIVPRTDPNTPTTVSPREYAATFRALYSATVVERSSSERTLELTAASTFHDGLVAGVPAGTVVSHKFGERTLVDAQGTRRELHDCGIVYHPRGPYVMCVMTEGDDFRTLASTIADLSKLAFTEAGAIELSSAN